MRTRDNCVVSSGLRWVSQANEMHTHRHSSHSLGPMWRCVIFFGTKRSIEFRHINDLPSRVCVSCVWAHLLSLHFCFHNDAIWAIQSERKAKNGFNKFEWISKLNQFSFMAVICLICRWSFVSFDSPIWVCAFFYRWPFVSVRMWRPYEIFPAEAGLWPVSTSERSRR